jgi:hypothetical protein
MRKLILTCALLTSVSLLSFGQNMAPAQQQATPARTAPAPEKIAEMRANRYKQQLGLTDDQVKGIYAAELEYAKANQQFTANGQPVPSGPAQQMMMTHDQKFQQVLTADQFAKYDKMRAVNRPGMGAQNAPTNAAPATGH